MPLIKYPLNTSYLNKNIKYSNFTIYKFSCHHYKNITICPPLDGITMTDKLTLTFIHFFHKMSFLCYTYFNIWLVTENLILFIYLFIFSTRLFFSCIRKLTGFYFDFGFSNRMKRVGKHAPIDYVSHLHD